MGSPSDMLRGTGPMTADGQIHVNQEVAKQASSAQYLLHRFTGVEVSRAQLEPWVGFLPNELSLKAAGEHVKPVCPCTPRVYCLGDCRINEDKCWVVRSLADFA